MKKIFLIVSFIVVSFMAKSQCSICTKTAQQLGEKPAKALNAGIVYLMVMPLSIGIYLGVKWWKNEKIIQQNSK